MHQVLVGNIAIRKYYGVDLVLGDQLFQVFLFENRNALRVQASGKFRRITSAGDIGNLRGRAMRPPGSRGCREIRR